MRTEVVREFFSAILSPETYHFGRNHYILFGLLWGLQRFQAQQGKVQLVDRIQYAEQLGLVSHRSSQGRDLAIAGFLFNLYLQLA